MWTNHVQPSHSQKHLLFCLQTLPVQLARSILHRRNWQRTGHLHLSHHLVTLKLPLCCRHSRRNTFLMAQTCWARFKTCCSAQQFSPLRWAAHLTPIQVSLFWCFTSSSETINSLKREKFKHLFLLYFFPFLCSRDRTLWGDCLPRRGAIRNRWTGWWPSPAGESSGATATQNASVWMCECRFVCRRTMGGYVMALRVLRQTRTPWYEWLTLFQHLFHGKLSLSHSRFSTNNLPDSVSVVSLSVSSPHTHKS